MSSFASVLLTYDIVEAADYMGLSPDDVRTVSLNLSRELLRYFTLERRMAWLAVPVPGPRLSKVQLEDTVRPLLASVTVPRTGAPGDRTCQMDPGSIDVRYTYISADEHRISYHGRVLLIGDELPEPWIINSGLATRKITGEVRVVVSLGEPIDRTAIDPEQRLRMLELAVRSAGTPGHAHGAGTGGHASGSSSGTGTRSTTIL